MPRVISELSEKLRPYLFHGVNLSWSEGGKEATGDCPWCGKEEHFGIEIATGLWHCLVCGEGTARGGGNANTFLRKLWEISDRGTRDYANLTAERRLLNAETLMRWGVCRSVLTEDWLVPGYDAVGKLRQLYKYVKADGRGKLLPTPTLGHQLHGIVDLKKPVVYVCEGPWDAMALEELLGQCKQTEQGLRPTANASRCLLNECSVVAVPGCSVWQDSWTGPMAGKVVRLMYDSDHPHRNEKAGTTSQPAGHQNMMRVAGLLMSSSTPPSSVEYLRWGEQGYDPNLPSGYDVRDCLSVSQDGTEPLSTLDGRLERLEQLLGRLVVVPATEAAKSAKKSGRKELECVACMDYRGLVMAWRKALRWTPGLDHALAAMLACVASTKLIGDQLWLKVISPAASGKSTLAEAVSVARKHVTAKSTIRGFHSGFKEDGSEGEDNSLISQLYDRTLIIKDGDTLLTSPNLPQILSEARDIYDGTSRTSYRNKMSKDYEGVRLTIILCGTSSLRTIDSSELGERFLDCVIMEGIDDELEDEVLSRVAYRADRNLSLESDGEAVSRYEPELASAMQMTGGYVEHLRQNAADLVAGVEFTPEAKHLCTRLGKFTAHMRARPSKHQAENAEREFASRLVSQLVRLAKCLAVVLNRGSVDEEVMNRVRRVAMDTSRGQTLNISAHLLDAGSEGLESRTMAMYTSRTEEETKRMLRFLKQIGVVELFVPERRGVKGKLRWRLTQRMRRLYREVMGMREQEPVT